MTGVLFRGLLFIAGIAAWLVAPVLAVAGRLGWAARAVAAALVMDALGRLLSRRGPIPFPHAFSWALRLPRGPQSPARLRRVIDPRPGERLLEIGAGIGVHAGAIAEALGPGGALYVCDIQPAMIRALQRRRRGFRQMLRPCVADAAALPFAAGVFDGAYAVTVLGEIRHPVDAMREVSRVLKPGGRLVVAELIVDPDFISRRRLADLARQSGFVPVRRDDQLIAYTGVFAKPGDSSPLLETPALEGSAP